MQGVKSEWGLQSKPGYLGLIIALQSLMLGKTGMH
jgi:hypothetical protein